MLKSLHIRNLAIIDELQLEFAKGFTVLTGETGAGKSILIDALGLVTGARADGGLVRHGREKAEISAEFELEPSHEAARWLREHELEDGEQPNVCLLRRVVYAEGRNRAFINGAPASVTALRELGERLLEVFGQNESQTLLRMETQRRLLDDFGGHDDALAAVSAAAQRWRECQSEIDKMQAAAPIDPAQLEYLRFQIRELEALNVAPGELDALEEDHKRLANAGKLLQQGSTVLEQVYNGESSAYDQLAGAVHTLDSLSDLHSEFGRVSELIASAQTQLQEAAQTLERLLDRLDLDPAELQRVEQRLGDLHDTARKYRVRASELPSRLENLNQELAASESGSMRLEELERRREKALQDYHTAAAQLHKARLEAAASFTTQVTARVRRLGMANAQLIVNVEPLSQGQPRAHGDDEVRFDFSANPGQVPRPLSKVASGGELSRVSLAIQVIALRQSAATTMIFDEVDAGIGGAVAEIVGSELRSLGRRHQVLCITHLAQVAAQGDAHLAIRKEVRSGETFTRIDRVHESRRIEELARMLGGLEITASTSAHAGELLSRAAAKAQ